MCVCWLQPSSSTLHCTERDVLERGVQRWADVNRDERWSIESARVCDKVEMRWDLDVSFEYVWVTEWNTRKRRTNIEKISCRVHASSPINIEKISCRVHASSPMLRRRSDSQNGAVRVPDIIRIGQFLWKIWKKNILVTFYTDGLYTTRGFNVILNWTFPVHCVGFVFKTFVLSSKISISDINKMLSYRRETALQGAL